MDKDRCGYLVGIKGSSEKNEWHMEKWKRGMLVMMLHFVEYHNFIGEINNNKKY